ncbi:MAG: hypothetical protein N2689_05020, partial [Verrucomicrobiae bacterium]|nr:hypothetical protein [Verrucomicrobiae bacterium]
AGARGEVAPKGTLGVLRGDGGVEEGAGGVHHQLDAALAQEQAKALAGKVKIDADKGEITVYVPLSKEDEAKLVACAKTPAAQQKITQTVNRVRETEQAFGGGQPRVASPYERQMEFVVPLLCVKEDDALFEFDTTHLLERPWKLSEKDASLSPDYNPLQRPGAKSGLIDVSRAGAVTTGIVPETGEGDFVGRLHQQTLQLGGAGEWSLESLTQWLDRNIEHADIPLAESAEFMRRVLRGLMARHGIEDVGTLALDRFRLRDEIEKKINAHRDAERRAAFQDFLRLDSPLVVDNQRVTDFRAMVYEPSWLYEGNFQFRKHYFGPKPGELRELKANGELTEEFQCAQFLDGLAEVQYWVRNLARKAGSFRLQTSKDWFYPDFVCRLVDGRVLAVEYKGGNVDAGWYATPDAEEKRLIGALWESRSGGKCLFIMPPGKDFEAIRRKVGARA